MYYLGEFIVITWFLVKKRGWQKSQSQRKRCDDGRRVQKEREI